MSSSGRPLAAAPTSRDKPMEDRRPSNPDPNQPPNPGKRTRRTLIESACSACRRRKSKCDGARPVCGRCEALRTVCIYEAQEGESRWSALKRQNKSLESERNDVLEILTFLQSQPEPEALEVLHRLRSSDTQESIPTVLSYIRERRSGSFPYSGPSVVAGQTRLPPIRTMIESSEAALSPVGQGGFRRRSLASDGSGASYGSSLSGGDVATSQPGST